jgi:hypothetical protein
MISSNLLKPVTAVEEFIIPADENFLRCPISKEAFQQVWDEEEGEMMYRNAVKVLVPQNADTHLFSNIAKPLFMLDASHPAADPTLSTLHTTIRYMIVHKLLIMDPWLEAKKACTVKEALETIRQQNPHDPLTDLIVQALGDEDEEDVFILLEEPKNVTGS